MTALELTGAYLVMGLVTLGIFSLDAEGATWRQRIALVLLWPLFICFAAG